MVGGVSVAISATGPDKVISRVHINLGAVSCPLMGFDRGKISKFWVDIRILRAVRLLDSKVQDFIKVRY